MAGILFLECHCCICIIIRKCIFGYLVEYLHYFSVGKKLFYIFCYIQLHQIIMSVVNVKVANIRKSGFANLQEWMNNKNNIYIGRAGIVFISGVRFPKQSSMFANPFKIGKDGTRDEVIEKYKNALEKHIAENPNVKDELLKMKGKNLGCWCSPEPCHGDVLQELIAKYDTTH